MKKIKNFAFFVVCILTASLSFSILANAGASTEEKTPEVKIEFSNAFYNESEVEQYLDFTITVDFRNCIDVKSALFEL